MNTGERIKSARRAAGLTQTELAEKIGLKFSVVSKYETGRVVNLKREVIDDIAKALNVRPSWLMCLDDKDPATSGGGLEEKIDLSQLSEDQKISIQELQKLNPHFQALARGLIESLLSSQQAGDNK